MSPAIKLTACLNLSEAQVAQLQKALAGLTDWTPLLNEAERNGLSALLYHHIKTHDLPAPDSALRVLRALVVRHKHAHQTRLETLEEIIKALDERGIPVILLKGAALVQTVYPSPELRPMSDLDLLVPPEHAGRAQRELQRLGYNAPMIQRARAHHHHHLPIAHKQKRGLTMQIEIHRRLLPPDAHVKKDFHSLARPLIPIQIGKRTVYALSHTDQLWHLCHHLLLPGEYLRLNALLDVYAYAEYYRKEFDWAAMPRQQPFVYNALRCLHYHLPMPEQLVRLVPPPEVPAPARVGEILPPLSVIQQTHPTLRGQARVLFDCSPWWQHAFYGLPPERNLITVRYLRHPLRVLFWLMQRSWATAESAFQQWRRKGRKDLASVFS